MDIKSNLHNNSKEEFFKLMLFFKNANYNQKLDVMKKCWGNITSTTTIHYSEGNSITIGFDSDNKYYFDFNCTECDIKTMAELFPEYVEAILSKDVDAVKAKHPEIRSLNYIQTNEEVVEQPVVDESKGESVDVGYEYLNIYNKINISDGKKSDNESAG